MSEKKHPKSTVEFSRDEHTLYDYLITRRFKIGKKKLFVSDIPEYLTILISKADVYGKILTGEQKRKVVIAVLQYHCPYDFIDALIPGMIDVIVGVAKKRIKIIKGAPCWKVCFNH